MDDFPHVFAPLTLRHRTLRSRINFGAHTTNMGEGGLAVGSPRRLLPGTGARRCRDDRRRAGAGARHGGAHAGQLPSRRRCGHSRISGASRTPARAAADGDVVMIQQLYHVGQHGDADNSFRENWSPSGLPSYARRRRQPCDDGGRDRRAHRRVRPRRRAGSSDGASTASSCSPPTTRSIDQFWTPWSNRRTDRWGGSLENRVRFSADAARRDQGRRAVTTSSSVWPSTSTPNRTASLSEAELQEIVAWHDERALMDYVTCGTGSYFDFYKLDADVAVSGPARRVRRGGAQGRRPQRGRAGREPHPHTRPRAEAVLAAGHADMVSIVRGQIADPHLVAKAAGGHARRGSPVHLVQPAVLGTSFAGLLDLMSGQSVGRA